MTQTQPESQNYIPEIHLQDYIQIILRRRWVILTFFIVLLTTVIIGTLKQTPIYEATATLMIERKSPRVISVQEVSQMGTSDYYDYKDYYETQYKLIKSRSLLTRVAELTGLSSEKDNHGVEKLLEIVNVIPIKSSQLVKISAEHSSADMAARISNTVAEEYIKQNLERNIGAANEAAQWLSERIDEQRQKLRDSEVTLQKYREKNNINILPEMTGDDAVENIMAEYAKAQALFANYSQRYTDEHPEMVELNAQINSLKNKIQGLEDVNLGDATMEYRVLEREVQGNKRMYEILLTRAKEIDLSGDLKVNNLSIIDRAVVPDKPAKPNIMLNIMLALIVGSVGGIGLGFFIDYLDTTVKTPEDIKEALKAYFLGAIPEMEEKDGLKRDKLVFYEPHSIIAEIYRVVRTEICQLIADREDVKAILITSAEPQAGKTITASNLALTLAQRQSRVVLVDCDLRKPQMDKIYKLDKEPGVAEYLLGTIGLDSIIKDTEVENLKCVTSGKLPRNPAEIISIERMETLISELKSRFDFVIIDSPPVISVTDAVILANMADAFICIVRSGKALVKIALRVKEMLSRVKARDLGMILNRIKAHHGNYYNYYYSKYHYYDQDTNNKGNIRGKDTKPRRIIQETA
ncbi:MAG: polysaccharide biosynthesis tyrosine autokinase [Candidatus Omnitrophota bacterium]